MNKLIGIFLFSIVLIQWACDGDTPSNLLSGTWKLEKITVDSRPDSAYTGDFVWKFQSNIIDMIQVNETLHERVEHLGTWWLANDNRMLHLDYTHSDNDTPPGTGKYSFPASMRFSGETVELEILKLSTKNMVLKWINVVDGKEFRYEFIKY